MSIYVMADLHLSTTTNKPMGIFGSRWCDHMEKIKKNSRNYAKRQYTWFKNQFDMNWFHVDLSNFEETVNEVLVFLKEKSVF